MDEVRCKNCGKASYDHIPTVSGVYWCKTTSFDPKTFDVVRWMLLQHKESGSVYRVHDVGNGSVDLIRISNEPAYGLDGRVVEWSRPSSDFAYADWTILPSYEVKGVMR